MQYMHITPEYAFHYKFVHGIFCGLFYSADKTKIYVIYLLASAPLSGSGVAEVLRTTPGVEDTGDTMAETGGGFNGD